MSEDYIPPKKSLVPHIVIGVVIVAVIVALLLWPQDEHVEKTSLNSDVSLANEPEPAPESLPDISAEPVIDEPAPITEQEDIFSEPDPVVPEPVEPPLDTSDGAVKTALALVAQYEALSGLLVNDALLERFVVSVSSIGQGDIPANHRLLTPPQKPFRIYQQASREWVDPASYKRYTPYVDVIDAMSASDLMTLYQRYYPAISEIYAEIGFPDEAFDDALLIAINHLLDTPEIPIPVEVYTDSVMYKYRDARLEALSSAQKQLLRTGPDNMRRLKAKLRELQDILPDGSR